MVSTIRHHRIHRISRFLGIVLAVMCASTWLLLPDVSFAAERSSIPQPVFQDVPDDALGTLSTRFESVARSASRIATPIAIFCIILVLIMYLFAPLLPEIAQQNKGYIIRALVIVAFISFVPELVRFVAALGTT